MTIVRSDGDQLEEFCQSSQYGYTAEQKGSSDRGSSFQAGGSLSLMGLLCLKDCMSREDAAGTSHGQY